MKTSLLEPGMKYYTKELFKRCKDKRKTYYNTIFNLLFGIITITVIILFLWNGRKSKIYKEMNKNKIEREKQEYIIETCKKMDDLKEKKRCEMISCLPFESEIHQQDKFFV